VFVTEEKAEHFALNFAFGGKYYDIIWITFGGQHSGQKKKYFGKGYVKILQ
jgi:hypothetical protein